MVDLVLAGLALVLVGFGLMAVSVLSQARKEGEGVKGGGVLLIGPVPTIFGSDMKWASIAIILAILLVLLALIVNVMV
jgi:uncharacterized protein (TIGR00304 family)